jgi:hypothetical protein
MCQIPNRSRILKWRINTILKRTKNKLKLIRIALQILLSCRLRHRLFRSQTRDCCHRSCLIRGKTWMCNRTTAGIKTRATNSKKLSPSLTWIIILKSIWEMSWSLKWSITKRISWNNTGCSPVKVGKHSFHKQVSVVLWISRKTKSERHQK